MNIPHTNGFHTDRMTVEKIIYSRHWQCQGLFKLKSVFILFVANRKTYKIQRLFIISSYVLLVTVKPGDLRSKRWTYLGICALHIS